VLPKECLICLHCEEACPTGAIFIKGAIRKQFKPTPVKDMWGWEGIKPPE
jgi:formate hydrogenlyase subunit 6/NADH:ubiquinone oxidoreductase subunit I